MSTIQTQSQPHAEGLPSRGTVLCVFNEAKSVELYESSLTACGFTLVRARHGMHGYWLAITSQPDVIVTDLMEPEADSGYFLNCLERNSKTRSIPVVAIIEAIEQDKPAVSGLRTASTCILQGTAPEELIAWIDDYIVDRAQAAGDAGIDTRDNQEVSRFDAYFADLGHATTPAPKANWSVEATAELLEEESNNDGTIVDGAHARYAHKARFNRTSRQHHAAKLGAVPRKRD